MESNMITKTLPAEEAKRAFAEWGARPTQTGITVEEAERRIAEREAAEKEAKRRLMPSTHEVVYLKKPVTLVEPKVVYLKPE
jgi:hypothetical protein